MENVYGHALYFNICLNNFDVQVNNGVDINIYSHASWVYITLIRIYRTVSMRCSSVWLQSHKIVRAMPCVSPNVSVVSVGKKAYLNTFDKKKRRAGGRTLLLDYYWEMKLSIYERQEWLLVLAWRSTHLSSFFAWSIFLKESRSEFLYRFRIRSHYW